MKTQIVKIIDFSEFTFSGTPKIIAECRNGNIVSIPWSFVKENRLFQKGDKIEVYVQVVGDERRGV